MINRRNSQILFLILSINTSEKLVSNFSLLFFIVHRWTFNSALIVKNEQSTEREELNRIKIWILIPHFLFLFTSLGEWFFFGENFLIFAKFERIFNTNLEILDAPEFNSYFFGHSTCGQETNARERQNFVTFYFVWNFAN